MKFLSYFRTALALGPISVFRAFRYRIGLKTGLNPVKRLRAAPTRGPYFFIPSEISSSLTPSDSWHTTAYAFGHIPLAITDTPPNWHTNVFTGKMLHEPLRPWWVISDFDPSVGDIKGIWELSRLDWALAFAQQASAGDLNSLSRLNNWLEDWCQHNPPYLGPNWKCGQEASIRVMHLAMAALMLRQTTSTAPALLSLIRQHLDRIVPTITYAMAQDNNHGTSEAAALYIGGSWLALNGDAKGKQLQGMGKRWLENRANYLIAADGTFSQYSVTYHRVMLDTYSMVEIWRRHQTLPAFSYSLYEKLHSATRWLYAMVDPSNGDAPNIGANDGARFFPLANTDYRDFRPSLHLAGTLFCNQSMYPPDKDTENPLIWVTLHSESAEPPPEAEPPKSQLFDQGGFAVLRKKTAMAILRYPRFRFRPSHADCMHVDFWLNGENLLRDAGTYSYNTSVDWLSYFPGTVSHNTIQFDHEDQMPRISRFLFGDWIRTNQTEPFISNKKLLSFGAQYRNRNGVTHHRRLNLAEGELHVEDRIAGFKETATLRWRLSPDRSWRLEGNTVTDGRHMLTVACSAPIGSMNLKTGAEARYYGLLSELPVLEVQVHANCQITSSYRWE